MQFNPKKTGSFYTCENVAQYLTDWAIRGYNDEVLEPSFGEGSFIDAAIARLAELGQNNPTIYAIEIRKDAFEQYKNNNIIRKHFYLQDFMSVSPSFKVDAAIGNPPYVRLNDLETTQKANAIKRTEMLGINMQTSGSLWMPFVAHASSFLKPGGRIAFVLPFEITYVKYGYALWNYLKENFSELTIIRVHEDFFPDVDVETVLFLADGFGGKTNTVNYYLVENQDDLYNNIFIKKSVISIRDIINGERPFMLAILSDEQNQLIQRLKRLQVIKRIKSECKFKIGYVSADKKYFHPTNKIIEKYSLPESCLVNCLQNTKQINSANVGVYLDEGTFSTKLFLPNELESGVYEYIKYGEEIGVNNRYKCKHRKPWYITPNVEVPDVILTVFGNLPKLLINNGGYVATNSLLCGKLTDEVTATNLICRWYNSLTLLFIELQVHSLGGGVLVFVPNEADSIYIINRIMIDDESAIVSDINECLKKGATEKAYELGDKAILRRYLNLNEHEISLIKDAIKELRWWRDPLNRRVK